jgi:putative transposase
MFSASRFADFYGSHFGADPFDGIQPSRDAPSERGVRPVRWRAIKAGFTRALARHGVPLVRDRRGEYDLWQRRFWEHMIRDDDDLARHVEYIHHNPVKHGLVTEAFDWRWSSIHAYARRGVIARDWNGRELDGRFGD